MSETSRFSQAQLLLAALFAVVVTGQIPEGTPCIDPEIVPLNVEFPDLLCGGRRNIRERLANASVKWLDYRGAREQVCKALCEIPVMPSRVAEIVDEMLAERGVRATTSPLLRARAPGLLPEIERTYGVQRSIIQYCWATPREMDESWNLCRHELQAIRAEVSL